MTNTHFATDGLIGANLEVPTTDAEFALGTKVTANDGTEFYYVQANGAIDAKDFVVVSEAYQATAAVLATGDYGDMGAVAQVAFADDEYGWVARIGSSSNLTVNTLASANANAVLHTTATAGHLDDGTVAGSNAVEGIVLSSAADSVAGATACIISSPLSIGADD